MTAGRQGRQVRSVDGYENWGNPMASVIEKPRQLLEVENERKARSSPRAEHPNRPTEHQRLETVLLVEDDRDLNQGLALRLQRGGLTVARAYDGPTGLEKFRLLQPDVVILDLCLPRMDGAKFLHFMRMAPAMRAVPIIAMTGSADPGLIRKVEHWGVRQILRKPVSPKELLDLTLEAIEGL